MSDDESDDVPLPPMLQEDADATLYKYRDFSTVADDSASEPSPNQVNRNSLESSIRVQKFPVKLYSILAQKEFSDIITWMPHGRAWKVLKPNLFESLVMPLFFEYSNYHSFNRLVNAWSFRRVSSGPDRGSYYHELFLRGRPHLQKFMRRLPKTHKKLPMKKHDEPDFYKLDKTSPLPNLEEPANRLNANVVALRQRQTNGTLTTGSGAFAGQSALTQEFSSAIIGSPMGSLGQIPSAATLSQGSGNYGFNRAGKDVTNGIGSVNSVGSINSLGAFNGIMGMSGLSSMNNLGSIGGMNNLGSIGGMNAMSAMNGMGSLSGIAGFGGISDSLRSPSMSGLPTGPLQGVLPNIGMLGAGAVQGGAGGDNQLFQLQRLRHLQHLQLFQRQIGATSLAGSDDLARLQAEHALGLR